VAGKKGGQSTKRPVATPSACSILTVDFERARKKGTNAVQLQRSAPAWFANLVAGVRRGDDRSHVTRHLPTTLTYVATRIRLESSLEFRGGRTRFRRGVLKLMLA